MKQFYFLLIILTVCSCGKESNNTYRINPNTFKGDNIDLSGIADGISYIPFDNTIPIGITYSMNLTKNNIYIGLQDVGIVQYDRNGNFIRVIARSGRGPGELYFGHDFVVDETNKKIYVVDRLKLKIYSLEGEYIRDIPTDNYFSGSAGDIEMLGSNIFLCDYGYSGEFKYHWVIIDTDGNLVSSKLSSDHPTGIVAGGFSYKFGNKIYYSNIINDTIFSISPDLSVAAAYFYAHGEYRWPPNLRDIGSMGTLLRTLLFETNRYYILKYSLNDKNAFQITDKITGESYQAYKEEKLVSVNYQASLKNNLDGGLPIENIKEKYVENGADYIAGLITPFELKAHVASDEFKNSTPKYPEKKQELEVLANSLDENDNPVLMLVRLKE